jgi:hypothetical protein
MKRRQFIQASGLLVLGLLTSTKLKAASVISMAAEAGNKYKEHIISIINNLKKEGTDLVKKIMDGKKYVFDPFTHYPYDGGIKDENTGCQLFFHIHRENEYGHFHTFATDTNGDLIHLILISMNQDGEPIGLATVNRWVTGDKYVKAEVLKKLTENFFVNPSLFKDPKVVRFVNHVFKAYNGEINQLYDERDRWIKNYVNNNYREPFEDRDYEILSETKINLQT